jgi:co-chaperonin GroES (HSP10)
MEIKRLLNGNVLVRPVKKEENKTAGGLIIIPTANTKSVNEVEILQLPENAGSYEVGDIALVSLYAGIPYNIDGEDVLIVNLQEIILVL